MIHSLPDKPMSPSWAEGDETCLVTCEVIFDRLGICGISIKVEK